MRKFSNIISLAACFVLLWGCDEYDDGELRQNIDAIEQELTETEKLSLIHISEPTRP